MVIIGILRIGVGVGRWIGSFSAKIRRIGGVVETVIARWLGA